MELTPLRTFMVLAETGQMTRTAQRLHLTQPAVSAQIARLEDELGVTLFDRTAKGVVLTEAGRTFLGYTRAAMERIEAGRAAIERLTGLEAGTLSLGGGATATTYLLPPLLGEYHRAHPQVRLFVREQGSRDVLANVLSGALDLGIVTLPFPDELDTRDRVRLDVRPWVEDELLLIVPQGHPLEGAKTFRWADLAGTDLVLFEGGTAVRRLLDQRLATSGAHIAMELRSIESIRQMVAQGIGAAFVSRHALDDPGMGLRAAEGQVTRTLAVVLRKDRTRSAATEAFLEQLAI